MRGGKRGRTEPFVPNDLTVTPVPKLFPQTGFFMNHPLTTLILGFLNIQILLVFGLKSYFPLFTVCSIWILCKQDIQYTQDIAYFVHKTKKNQHFGSSVLLASNIYFLIKDIR